MENGTWNAIELQWWRMWIWYRISRITGEYGCEIIYVDWIIKPETPVCVSRPYENRWLYKDVNITILRWYDHSNMYGRQRRVIGSWKMYKDGSASVAHSLLLLLAHRRTQSCTWTACAFLAKADLAHRRKGSCISPEPAAPNPLRLSCGSHNFENERSRVRQAYGSSQ